MSICELGLIKINIKDRIFIPTKSCKQADTLILDFQIWDGSVLADINGWACMLKANKNNGMGYQIEESQVTASNSTIHIECKSTLTQFAGKLLLELFFSKNGLQKTSFNIEIQVEKTVLGNSDGTVPECIITPLEKLDENLAKISESINNANAAKTSLDSSTNIANNVNATLGSSINIANTSKGNLDSSISSGKATIDELKKTNSAYTDHINNTDIHVTKTQKDKWDAYEAKIQELTTIIDDVLYKDAVVVDDEGNTIIDDEENTIIV